MAKRLNAIIFGFVLFFGVAQLSSPFVGSALCQDQMPDDTGLFNYHTSPRYRESESHPLRTAAYVLHPVGWIAREAVYRPLSALFGSTRFTRSFFGFREPFDYRRPECFSGDDTVPDCRSLSPFNYESPVTSDVASDVGSMDTHDSQVFFPDINFDFDKRTLNALGKGKVKVLASMLSSKPNITVVLEGHADYKGSDAYNQKLGMDRAEAVRMELENLGVSGARLSTVSFGETQPLIDEDSDWARAVNRRVSVKPEGSSEKKGQLTWTPAYDN